jgi:hypothetical protein
MHTKEVCTAQLCMLLLQERVVWIGRASLTTICAVPLAGTTGTVGSCDECSAGLCAVGGQGGGAWSAAQKRAQAASGVCIER